MKKLKPAGQGHLKQTMSPSDDFGSHRPTVITRYGPDTTLTNYPASRVATGRIPPTGAGMKRYTASTDGSPIRVPRISRASKYDHGAGAEAQTHMDRDVAETGLSQDPVQSTLTRRGKHKEG